MKKIGIVGGLGPESTVDYYRGIIEAFNPTYEQLGYPEIGIESVDLRSFTADAQEGAWDKIASIISNRFEILRWGGAQLGAIASNTPHKVFDQVQQNTSLPLLSIVAAARDHADQLGVKTLCLLGTKSTMESDFFPRTFQEAGITVVVPNPEEIDYIQEKLFSEIEFGVIKGSTKDRFVSVIDRIAADQNIEGVILGCTELPLLLKPEDISMQYIDTTAIHIAKIIERCRED
jgi:aspartate racemase